MEDNLPSRFVSMVDNRPSNVKQLSNPFENNTMRGVIGREFLPAGLQVIQRIRRTMGVEVIQADLEAANSMKNIDPGPGGKVLLANTTPSLLNPESTGNAPRRLSSLKRQIGETVKTEAATGLFSGTYEPPNERPIQFHSPSAPI